MVKLLLGAAAALAAFAVPAAPAGAQHPRIETAVNLHLARQGDWRGDHRRWRGDRWSDHRRWRGDRRGHDWRDRRWRDDRWHRPPPRHWRGHPGLVWRNPCRSFWWDGWSWRCRW